MEKKKRIKLIFIYYVIIIALLIQGFTFSQYLITSSGEATIKTSEFSFKITEQMSSVELNLSDTIIANLYSDDKLVPGSKGVLELKMDFSEIETATRYSVSIDTEKSKIPANMKLYTDSSYSVEFSKYTGINELGTKEVSRLIYWKWNYTTIDETQDWMGQDINIVLDITAEQRTN